MSTEKSMEFIADFLEHYMTVGIQDKFDNQTNKMVTSPAILAFVKRAQEILPPKLLRKEAAVKMRELPEDERNLAIVESPEKVVDARAEFARRFAANGSLRGLVERLVNEPTIDDVAEAKKLLEMNNE